MTILLVLLPVIALLVWAGLRSRAASRPVTRADQCAELLAAADAARAAGRTPQALRAYRKLAERLVGAVLSPTLRKGRGNALVGQGLCTAALGDGPAALRLYREAFALTELPPEALLALAEDIAAGAAPDAGAGAEELDIVLAALAAAPGQAAGPVDGYLQQRCLAARRRGHAEVADLARRVLLAAPGLEWAVLARSAAQRAGGRPADAEATLLVATGRATAGGAVTGSAEIWFRLGVLLAGQGRHPEAVQALDEAARRPPGTPSPWTLGERLRREVPLQRGIAHREAGDPVRARADLDAAVREGPDDPRTHYARGVLAVAEQDDAAAGACFEAALRADADHAPARFGLGLLAERAADPATAVAQYQAGLARTPGWEPGRVRLGAALAAAAQPAQALHFLDGLRTAEAEHHRGLAHAALGDPAAAAESWAGLEQIPAVARNLATARDHLARRALAAGDHARARELWESCRELHPDGTHPAAATWPALVAEAALREGGTALLARPTDDLARRRITRLLRIALLSDPEDARATHLLAVPALLRGDAAVVVDLLRPLGQRLLTPRGRHHLALARLLQGRPALAVALLGEQAGAERPGPGGTAAPDAAEAFPRDPAEAVLRGALAARAGSWARAAALYAHALDPGPEPGDLPGGEPGVPALRCAVGEGAAHGAAVAGGASGDGAAGGCTAPSTVRCGQCGRPCCHDHAAVLPPGSPAEAPGTTPAASGTSTASRTSTATPAARCRSCLAPVTAALLDAARRAGDLDRAEAALTRWAPADPVARRTAALLRAERGDLAGAAQAYGEAGQDRAARAALAGIRFALAVRAAREQRYEEAEQQLDLTLELAPAHPTGLRGKQLLAERRADLDEQEGRHPQAWEHRRASWQQAPGDLAAIHALALAAHRLAASGAGRTYWEWTAACWAAVLHSPAFWELLAERTGRTPGPEQIAAARAALAERIGRDLREAEAADGPADQAAGTALDVRWSLELQAAEEMARAAQAGHGPAGLACGPLLLARIREQPAGPAWTGPLDSALAARGGDGLARLAALLSPLGVQHHLLEQGLYEDAVSALAGLEGEEAADLLTEVLLRQAGERHRHREWAAALDSWTRAAAGGAALGTRREQIADAALQGVRSLLAEDSENHAGAVALLEQALALAPGHHGVRQNLGASYLQLGRKVNNEQRDYAEALRLVRLALEFTPDDELVRRTAGTVLGNRAGALMDEGRDSDFAQAEELLREALTLADSDDTRRALSGVLYRKGRKLALARDRAPALAAATQAVVLDPEKDIVDARAEGRRILGVMLHNHALGEEFKSRPAERIGLLEEARWYEDDAQTREALAWTLRNHGVDRANANDFTRAVALLKKSLEVLDLADTRQQLALCYRIQAVALANRRDLYGARRAVREGLEIDPYNTELMMLNTQLARMR
ncbi:hypothetical protein GCM10010495_23050 [Kitasatospora herbaricolor]|uniref:hypothetical protein n=1 Tax=Kitasatospora herbaricolor TaxID=68217 RepID=UPI00174A9577|nr:hypothetical protein [Kitasatospora herbaricolor]MDQ0308910.1 tetratricopeptide (TPR) repeat protein [Kitasatospora herbaricolor]GGV09507.1 hypothetical protein GCM10010495_23050 [Kitasatospora herbaricolor]